MRKNPYKPEEPKSWKIWRGYKTDVIFCIMIIFVSKFPKTNSSLIHGESWEFTEILNLNIACTRWLILMWIRRYSCLFIKKVWRGFCLIDESLEKLWHLLQTWNICQVGRSYFFWIFEYTSPLYPSWKSFSF